MKKTQSYFWIIGMFLLACTLYRVWDNRPLNFTPVLAMAIFAGAVIRDKKLAFAVPLSCMLLSDALYQLLYANGLSEIPGFYEGQVINYLLIGSMVFIGMLIRRIQIGNVLAASLLAPTLYFLLSNFAYWIGGGIDVTTSLPLNRSWEGFVQANAQAIPFFRGLVLSTVVFSAIFFLAYFFLVKYRVIRQAKVAG